MDSLHKQIQAVVQAYSGAILAMYDNVAWSTYRLGEVVNSKGPASGWPATGNQWYPSRNPGASPPPADRSNEYYSDISIEGLQRRGVPFLVCYQTIHAQAGQVESSANAALAYDQRALRAKLLRLETEVILLQADSRHA
jgi:hypothetical protein